MPDRVEIVEVPSNLGLLPGGVEGAPAALRAAGLPERLDARRVREVSCPKHDPTRDAGTGLLNSTGIVTVATRLADTLESVLDDGGFPVVVGGDCSILLGSMLALRRRGRYGLLHVDGHVDFWHPSHVRDTAISVHDLGDVRRLGIDACTSAALAAATRAELDGAWIHLDVDVLDDELMPAVDYREPGGLTWEEVEHVLAAAADTGRIAGLEVTIYNPSLDEPGAPRAARLVDLLAAGLGASGG